MSLFLLKPHVIGPEGNITTPDIVVDRLFVDGAVRPVGLVTHDCWQQAPAEDTAQGAYVLMALGGGALILPCVVLGSGAVIVARKAWRLNNLDGHVGKVSLNGTSLAEIGVPEVEIAAAGGTGDTLPRGYLMVRTATGNTTKAVLEDPGLGRKLAHRVVLEDVAGDRWGGGRPKPRYSVGPMMKEVPHFI